MVASCRWLLAGVSAAVVGVCATPAAALQYRAPVQLTAASTCAATVGVVVADFDADGNKDLAVAGPTCARILLQNGATGQFPADRVLTISGEHITAITSGDATGDGKPDLLIAESAADGSWPLVRVVYRNAQNGLINENFSQGSAYIFTDFVPSAVVAAKVDGDALPNLLVLDRTNGLLRTLVGQGTTTPVTSWSNTGQTLAVGSTPVAMVAGEFDNTLWTDHDDVAILSKDDATVTVLHTTAEEPTTWSTAKTIPLPDGTFSQPAPDPGGVGDTVDPTMAVVQVDPNSANGDLVIQDPGGSPILIRRASEYPGFGSEVAALPLSADGKLAVARVNDDNRLDLVLGASDLRFTA